MWERAKREASQPRILLATSVGGHNICATLEGALGAALTLRGAAVDFLLCDGLPGCMLTKVGSENPERVANSDNARTLFVLCAVWLLGHQSAGVGCSLVKQVLDGRGSARGRNLCKELLDRQR